MLDGSKGVCELQNDLVRLRTYARTRLASGSGRGSAEIHPVDETVHGKKATGCLNKTVPEAIPKGVGLCPAPVKCKKIWSSSRVSEETREDRSERASANSELMSFMMPMVARKVPNEMALENTLWA